MSDKRISRRSIAGRELNEAMVIAFALGWHAVETHHHGAGQLLELALDDALCRATWRQHRAAIIVEAKRRGLPRPLWAETQFDGADGGPDAT